MKRGRSNQVSLKSNLPAEGVFIFRVVLLKVNK